MITKVGGLIIILIILIICTTVLGGIYIKARCESKAGMFADPKYEERIEKLENQMEELKKE